VNIKEYSAENLMKLNLKKTNFMVFNKTKKYKFKPECKIEGTEISTLDEIKILGTVISKDLTWKANTKMILAKAYRRLWIIRRLKSNGASQSDLIDIYVKQIRSIMEFAVPVWNSALTCSEINDLERVQKSFLHILLGRAYTNYNSALLLSGLESLAERRTILCMKFALKTSQNPKHRHWFTTNTKQRPTRNKGPTFKVPRFKHERFRKSPIVYLTNLLNSL